MIKEVRLFIEVPEGLEFSLVGKRRVGRGTGMNMMIGSNKEIIRVLDGGVGGDVLPKEWIS